MLTQTRRLKTALMLAVAPIALWAVPALAQAQNDPAVLEEVIVSANRRDQALTKVPASVAVFTQEKLDAQGVKSIDDIAVLTPGLNFTRGSQFTGSNTQISIRGIASTVGAATTGIYIDDVPIQARSVGFSTSNTYPKVFDLQRVEVLRGPQGTLFGAGSEGGAVRFITPQPSLSGYSAYGRSELSFTEGGDANYEAGFALGGPVVEDKLGFRASAFYRRDGGWIDRADPLTGKVAEENSNHQETTAFKAAFTWAPNAQFQATPQIYYQKVETGDTGAYWESLSKPGDSDFKSGGAQAQPTKDTFVLPSLNLRYDFGAAQLIATTAYFDRKAVEHRDYTNFDIGLLLPTSPYPFLPGQVATGYMGDRQKIFTQEVRLESHQPDARLDWVVGGFFSDDRQTATQKNQDAFYEPMLISLYGLSFADLGTAYLPGNLVYDSLTKSKTRQIAGFGQVDFKVTDRLTATAGVRVAETRVDHQQVASGFWADAGGINSTGTKTETSVTPKFGLAFQADPATLLYASAAKGFRPGGAQTAVPQGLCGADLTSLGLSGSPTTYESDSVWSYEAGVKKGFGGGRIQTEANVYMIDWNNIQRWVDLPSCGSGFIRNAGSVTSKGFDFAVQGKVTPNLTLGVTLGYTHAEFNETIGVGATALMVAKGDSALDGPGFTYTISGQYDFTVLGGRDAYVRADYSHAGAEKDPNLAVFGVNPQDTPAPATDLLDMRAGLKIADVEVSLFAKNLTNEHAGLSRLQLFAGSPLITNSTFRPRTVGLTLNYRY